MSKVNVIIKAFIITLLLFSWIIFLFIWKSYYFPSENSRVYFSEMFSTPTIEINKNNLVLNVQNSKKNSALKVYKINYTIDSINKEIYIRWYQWVMFNNKSPYNILVKELTSEEILEYKIYWLDSNDEKNLLN